MAKPLSFLSWEPMCDRRQALEEKDTIREQRNVERRCHMSNTRPGFQTLTKMKYKGE
jgi:hypothetical protein